MAGAGAQGKTSWMTTAIVVVLLSLVGAGAGFAVGAFLQPARSAPPQAIPPSATASAASVETKAGQAEPASGVTDAEVEDDAVNEADVKIVPLPPVLTTLAAPEGKWIRLEGSILTRPGAEKAPDLLAEMAGEQILAYLRTVRLEQLQGPSGLLALRDDLNETVRSLSKGDVRAVLIHGLLVE